MRAAQVTDRMVMIGISLAMILFGFVTLYPFVNIVAVSLNEASDTIKGHLYLWPRQFTLRNYQKVFENPSLPTAAKVSVLRTVAGTILSVLCSSMLAFTLSRRDFFARRFFTVVIVLTMYFSGGMVPEYLLVKNLGLINRFWVYILPTMMNVWNVIVLRCYIDGLPFSFQESAKLDGANDLVIFFRIIFPLCLPVIASISLFVAVFQWNSWFDTYLYASRTKGLTTLQYEMMKLLMYSNTSMDASAFRTADPQRNVVLTPESVRASITVVATLPIIIVYPFIQRYFVKGLTLGGVKS